MFSEVLESYHAIQTTNLTRGSVNQVAACCGNTFNIFDCISSKLGSGICSESSYTAPNDTCDQNVCKPFVVVSRNQIIFSFFDVS